MIEDKEDIVENKDNKNIVEDKNFIIALMANIGGLIIFLLATIGIWWWFTPLKSLPQPIPFVIGTLVAKLFCSFNEEHPTHHAVGDAIGKLCTSVFFGLYFIALLMSIFCYCFNIH